MKSAAADLNLPFLLGELDFNCLTDQVYLVGSFCDGYANSGSDIDLYVFGELAGRENHVRYSNVVGRWLDVRYITPADIQLVKRRVEVNDGLPQRWGAHHTASLENLDIYHRLANAVLLTVPMITSKGEGLVEPGKLKFEAAITHLIIARARWEDAAGALECGDLSQCGFVAEIGLWHALDGIAALTGETNPSSKWRLRKLMQLQLGAAWFKESVAYLVHDRPRTFASVVALHMLGRLIYQITHQLHFGRFDSCFPDCETSTRIEIDAAGKLLVGAGTRAHRF